MSRGSREAWERRRKTPSTSVDLVDRVMLPAGPEEIWRRLNDVEAVAECIPGLVPGSLERLDERRFVGTLRHTALGVPATWTLRADVQPSEAERRLAVQLEGEEARLGLRLSGWATMAVEPGAAGDSGLDYRAHVEVVGRLAATGGPVIRSVVDGIVRRFVASVGGAPAPTPGILARLLEAIRKLLGRRGGSR